MKAFEADRGYCKCSFTFLASEEARYITGQVIFVQIFYGMGYVTKKVKCLGVELAHKTVFRLRCPSDANPMLLGRTSVRQDNARTAALYKITPVLHWQGKNRTELKYEYKSSSNRYGRYYPQLEIV